ncbi:anti-sigma factor [Saliterribacillus persicus]|uniref:Anti-sigma-W factor RsiW n=1 Tax=Saliterribacillus persicus TaxID=930114 RepID=A0A368Y9D1_9BACI|nr:anti-sigma factor [Saliterribacillus persicus]RCW76881.1 putative zinc finger protein [Saliterribacillus persicus]
MRQEACNLLIDYFNNQLSKEDKEIFEQHLESCESCQEELKELEEFTEDLPYMSESITPPEDMKARVLTNIFASEKEEDATVDQNKKAEPEQGSNVSSFPLEKRKSKNKNWLTPLLAAGLLVSVLGNGILVMNQSEDTAESPEIEQEESLDRTQLSAQLAPSEGIEASATATMVEKQNSLNLMIQANNLSALEGDQTYQVWVLEGEKPYRAGTFVPNEEGFGAVSFEMDQLGDHDWDVIAITKEPNATSETPQGDIILSTEL